MERERILKIVIYDMKLYIYSASQKKRNRQVLMFYHNLITTIINK